MWLLLAYRFLFHLVLIHFDVKLMPGLAAEKKGNFKVISWAILSSFAILSSDENFIFKDLFLPAGCRPSDFLPF